MKLVIFHMICFVNLLILSIGLVEAKVTWCREPLNTKKHDFFYCTKFAVAQGKAFKSNYKAQFTLN